MRAASNVRGAAHPRIREHPGVRPDTSPSSTGDFGTQVVDRRTRAARPVPLFCALNFARIASERTWVLIAYLITVFVVLPGLVILLIGVL